MAAGQYTGTHTGRVRRLRQTARFLVLAAALPCLADTAPVVAHPAVPAIKLPKPSAYHAVEPARQPAKPLPKPVPAPVRRPIAARPAPPRQAPQNRALLNQPQRPNAPLQARLTPAPRPVPRYPAPSYTEPHYVHPQPAPTPALLQQESRLPEQYSPNRVYTYPMPRPNPVPLMTAYPATPSARRVLYQGNGYVRREKSPNATDHLPAWMRKHQNQSPADRERSLREEPGFNRLTPAQQQNLINTLHRLNEMPPDQRERTLMRMENLERLSPQMRDAVRSSARQLNDLPPERRRVWQKAFRDLREMPPEQRQEVLRSQEFASQFSAQERSIMYNLLAVEPYHNPGPAEAPPVYGR